VEANLSSLVHVTTCDFCDGEAMTKACIEAPMIHKKLLLLRHPVHIDAKASAPSLLISSQSQVRNRSKTILLEIPGKLVLLMKGLARASFGLAPNLLQVLFEK